MSFGSILVSILIFFISCGINPSLHPHTKAGQSKIEALKIHTPYYVDYHTNNAVIPLSVRWKGPVDRLSIKVYFIIRPTSHRPLFQVYQNNIYGNRYLVYNESFRTYGKRIEETISVFQPGEYQVSVTVSNRWWSKTSNSRFSVK